MTEQCNHYDPNPVGDESLELIGRFFPPKAGQAVVPPQNDGLSRHSERSEESAFLLKTPLPSAKVTDRMVILSTFASLSINSAIRFFELLERFFVEDSSE